MTPGILMWLAVAVGGALVVWHNVSRTKHVCEEMLRSYRDALAEARAKKARQRAEEEEQSKQQAKRQA